MIISAIEYSQNIGLYDEWHLEDVSLGRVNLIVSSNAVGKTRTVNIMNSLVRHITGKIPRLLNGNWDMSFVHDGKTRRYILRIAEGKVLEETLSENERVLLHRTEDKGKITHYVNGQEKEYEFYPPPNKLTNQVRRDLKELPYLEELTKWAENYRSLTFSNIRPNMLAVLVRGPTEIGTSGPDLFSEDLSLIPYLLEEVQDDVGVKRRIVEDLEYVGYKVQDVGAVPSVVPNAPPGIRLIRAMESGVEFPIEQTSLSQGMYRVMAIIIAVNYWLSKVVEGTLVIDDLGEGLDFERSSKLAEMLFKKMENTELQLIVTSNDRFLMNVVDLKYWNVFVRKGCVVKAFNYRNSKKAFDEFMLTGLNNFDFFANRLYEEKSLD